MFVTCVTVYVKPEHIDDFIRATITNHNESVREPGNMRFDVLQCIDDPSRFLLYEAYETEAAAAGHKQTPHYLAWRETIADWMAKPRQGVAHQVIRPLNREGW
jgi:autoinducer 2-degrading protein